MPALNPSIRKLLPVLRSAATIFALVVVVPFVLVRVAQWPLPEQVPDPANMWLSIRQQNIGSDVVVKSIAAVAWVLWAQLMWALIWELAVCLPRIAKGGTPRRAPLVVPAIGSLAVRLVSGTMAVGVFFASPAVASALPAQMHSTIAAPNASATAAATGDSGSPSLTTPDERKLADSGPSVWVVQRGETAWSIAESVLGDGARFNEILALNPGINAARDVVTGTRLVLPAGADGLPGTEQTEYETRFETDDDITLDGDIWESIRERGLGFVAAEQVEIEQGDHLWGLSQDRLEESLGETPSDLEVLRYVNDVIDNNESVVEDPDLIYPGELFTFPQIGIEATEPAPDSEVAAATEPTVLPDEATAAEPAHETDLATPTVRLVAESDEAALSTSSAPYIAGIAGALVSATGLLALYRALQRRRATRGERASAQSTTDLERALVSASNMPLLRWAGQELSMLMSELDESTAGGPLAVEITPEGLELLWDLARPEAPHPWEAADGGVAWRLLYDADAPIPDDELPAGIPALVTIGTRQDGGTVLIDLEASGSLAVSGEPDDVNNTVRAMVTELGASEDLANVQVITVGCDLGIPPELDRVKASTLPKALKQARTVRHQYQAMIDEHDTGDSFGLRVATGAGPEALVVVVHTDSCTDLSELLDVAEPRKGITVIVVGENTAAASSLHVIRDGTATLWPLGLQVKATTMPRETLDQVALEGSTTEDEEAGEATDAEVWNLVFGEPEEPEETHLGENQPVGETALPVPLVFDINTEPEWERPSADVVVSLLGEPHIDGYSNLSPRQVALLGLLACHGGRASAEFVMDHLWADQDNARSRKTLWNLQSAVRRVVGAEVFPLSPKDQQLVTNAICDVTTFEALAKRATEVSSGEALGLLVDTLGLVQGAPFDHSQFEWARSIEVYEPVRQMIEAAALRLTDLALEAGMSSVARTGISQGLKALGVNEPLYRARMRVEAHNGDQAGVAKVYQELRDRLSDLFDGAEPSDASAEMMAELTNAAGMRAA